ncbi:Predicted integral membrane protein [Candidatus Terasakiella magnetica]|nr:Predicted integral membrane protein [Candidatus Terasakiella magnetica]
MDYSYGLAMGLHTLAALVWVGGMFFAHMILRPAALDLPPPQRLALWRGVFSHFFPWVWACILILLATGYGVLLLGFRGGFAGGPTHVDLMQVAGLTMMVLYTQLFFGPWQGFKRALAADEWEKAAGYQVRIRHIVTANLILGLGTVFVGVVGSLLGT